MTDDWPPEHRELHSAPPARGTSRPIPWLMIGGIILLGILLLVLAILVMGGGRDPGASPSSDASGEASAEPSTTATALSPPASDAASPGGSAAAGPSVAPTELTVDTIVVTTADGLSVRADPGTGAERLGSLANGTPGFVAGGSVDADGYRWYPLSGNCSRASLVRTSWSVAMSFRRSLKVWH